MDNKVLQVFLDSEDMIIAYDLNDALQVWSEAHQTVRVDDSKEFEDLSEIFDDGILSIHYAEEDLPTQFPNGFEIELIGEGVWKISATARAWCDCMGRGMLSSRSE